MTNEIIDIWPGGYTTYSNDVGHDVADLVTKMSAMNMTDPATKTVWINVMGRLIGETIAHELHHSLLDPASFDATGHNSPPIPGDLMNVGDQRPFVSRTGIEIFDQVGFPHAGTYADGGIEVINRLSPSNQAKMDALFPVPPAFR